MNNEKKQYDSFIFTHIPKCGGTSFRKYINDAALASGINKDEIYIPGFNGLSHDKNLSQVNKEELSILKVKKIKILANHSKFDEHYTHGIKISSPFYFTILREPVERCISHYNFFYYKHGNSGCKNIKLQDLDKIKLNSILDVISNVQTQYLANIKFVKMFGLKNILKVAKYNLEYEYNSFGLLANMNDSIDLLVSDLPSWLSLDKTFPLANVNKTDFSIPQHILELIKEKNYLDMDLYNFALQVFHKKLNKLSNNNTISDYEKL